MLGLSAAAVLAVAVDAVVGDGELLPEWPTLVAIVVALVWIWAGTDDYRSGTHRRIPRMLDEEAANHPVGWYRRVLVAVRPHGQLIGWVVPASMYVIGASYLAGIAVRPAAIGALILLVTMFLFLKLRHPRDDYVLLALAQIVILVDSPGGIPALMRAMQ